MEKEKQLIARGQVITQEDKMGVFGLRIFLYDKDHIFDDRLGCAITDEKGYFTIGYTERNYKDLLEKAPDLYIKILDCRDKMIYCTEDSVSWDARPDEEFYIQLPKATLAYHLANSSPLAKVKGGLVAVEKLQVISQAAKLLTALTDRGLLNLGIPGTQIPRGGTPVLASASYCPAPDILIFDNFLDICSGVLGNNIPDTNRFWDIMTTLQYRMNVRKYDQVSAMEENWQSKELPDLKALKAIVDAKRSSFGSSPSETIIERDRILPIIAAAIVAANGDIVVENRFLSILLGQITALEQLDVIYRCALGTMGTNPITLDNPDPSASILCHTGGTCGPDDGPLFWPPSAEEWSEMRHIAILEILQCAAEIVTSWDHGTSAGSYEITGIDWDSECPGSLVTIIGEGFEGIFPDQNRVLFTNRDGISCAPAAPIDPEADWTDTRIVVPLPEEAGLGPVSLQIKGSFVSACGRSIEIDRRGQGRTFEFTGGAAFIRVFEADGDRGTVIADPGGTVTLRWVAVPAHADIQLMVSTDGAAIPIPAGLHAEDEFDIAIPALGGSVTICTLTARNNACPQPADVRTITIIGYSEPALSIAGIEITQAVQHFNITGDTSQNNSLRLAEGKRTLVRVYVDSGRRDGLSMGEGANVQPHVTGHLTVEDIDTGIVVGDISPVNFNSSINAPSLPNIQRDDFGHSLNFDLPLELIRGRKQFLVGVESISPIGHRYHAEGSVEISFNAMGTMRLVRIICTDNNTGDSATISDWNAGLQGARTRYPLASENIRIFIAPGNQTVSTNEDLTKEDGWIDLLDDLEDIAEDYKDAEEYYWCMTVPDDISYDLNGISTNEDYPRLIARENLPATFAHELGHAHDIGHSNCCDPSRCPITGIDGRLPDDGHYHDTGVDVYTYTIFPPEHGEIMSYCDGPSILGTRPYQTRWPSAEFWNIIFDIYS